MIQGGGIGNARIGGFGEKWKWGVVEVVMLNFLPGRINFNDGIGRINGVCCSFGARVTFRKLQGMDFITHVLTGELANKVISVSLIRPAVYLGCIIPDVGEILIQKALSKKFGEKLAVYDDRTSDVEIASQIQITYLYDFLHSPLTALAVIGCGFVAQKYQLERAFLLLISLGVGMISHVILDSFTHGKVWALKFLYPFSNKRYPILEEKIGNWWDWQPVIKLPVLEFPFPVICILIWIILFVAIITFS